MTNREKKDAARAYALSDGLSDHNLQSFAFPNDQERLDAKMIADLYRSGHIKEGGEILAIAVSNSEDHRRLLRLIDKEMRGKRIKPCFTAKACNIIRADVVVAGAIDSGAHVTLHTVRLEYAALFVKEPRPRNMSASAWLAKLELENKIPNYKTFQQTLKRYGADICVREKRDRSGSTTSKKGSKSG